jgi:hypothetical protein
MNLNQRFETSAEATYPERVCWCCSCSAKTPYSETGACHAVLFPVITRAKACPGLLAPQLGDELAATRMATLASEALVAEDHIGEKNLEQLRPEL